MTITVTPQEGTEIETVGASKEETKSAPEAKASEQKQASESETGETEEGKEAPAESDEPDSKSKEKSEDEEDEEAESKEAATDKPKKKGGFQRRIDKLNAAKADAQREADYWKREALKKNATEPAKSEVESKVEKTADGEPKADDFENHSDYVRALAEWIADTKIRERDAKEAKAKLENEHQQKLNTHYAREKAFADKTPDYLEALEEVDNFSSASPALSQLVVDSENGPELMYALAKNREEFERINSLPPLAAARELGKFEAKLNAKPSEETKPEKKITKAPAPIAPVGSKGGTVEKSIYDAENLSQREYEELRAKKRSA